MGECKRKITKAKQTPQYLTHCDYFLSLLDKMTNELKPNWSGWWRGAVAFTKPLAAAPLLARLQQSADPCSVICNI